MTTQRFDIDAFISTLQRHHPEWRAPVITLVARRGASPFEILVSTLLSLRTKDEVTIAATDRLLKVARTPDQVLALDTGQIERLIYPVGFYATKAKRLKEISRILIEQYHGLVPDNMNQLLALPGVGRKTANMVLAEWFGLPGIIVDTHVDRVSRRIGLTDKKQPDKVEADLMEIVAKTNWSLFSHLLLFHGREICISRKPKCEQCKISRFCDYFRNNGEY